MESSKPIHLLEELFTTKYFKNIGSDLKLQKIRSSWNEIVGPLAKNTFPEKLDLQNLTIHANHAAYVQEIQILQNTIISNIKNNLKITIKKIVVKKGNINWKSEMKDKEKHNFNEDQINSLKEFLKEIK